MSTAIECARGPPVHAESAMTQDQQEREESNMTRKEKNTMSDRAKSVDEMTWVVPIEGDLRKVIKTVKGILDDLLDGKSPEEPDEDLGDAQDTLRVAFNLARAQREAWAIAHGQPC